MAARRVTLPPFLEVVPVGLARLAEGVVDAMAEVAYRFIAATPVFSGLEEREKRALAYAVVGDLIASPIPEPLDVPVDIVVQEKLERLLPEMGKYRRMYARIAEFIPVLELLPTYTLTVMATIREKESI